MKKILALPLMALSTLSFAAVDLSQIECEGRVFEHGFYTPVPMQITSGGAAISDYLLGIDGARAFVIHPVKLDSQNNLVVSVGVFADHNIVMNKEVTIFENEYSMKVRSDDGQYAIECVL